VGMHRPEQGSFQWEAVHSPKVPKVSSFGKPFHLILNLFPNFKVGNTVLVICNCHQDYTIHHLTHISPLTYICNSILNSGIFPDRLKYAIIKPIFKKGDDQEIMNYRPISLFTSFSKVIEKLIYVRLLDHINTNCILVNEQYGFRTQSSTEQATFSLINNVLTAMNNNLKIGGIFCDL
jgi:hypothetical protein